jgi:hypothetical protein
MAIAIQGDKMLTGYLPGFLMMLLPCVCVGAYGQQQSTGDLQNPSPPPQNGNTAPSTPHVPLKLPPIKSPDPKEVNNPQDPDPFHPALSAAPDVKLSPEKGFPGLPLASGSFSISDHDADQGRDIMKDLIEQGAKDQGLTVPLSPESAFMDALQPVLKKIGVPALAGDVLNGGALVMDSEPTAGKNLDYPDLVRYGQSVLSNLGSVAGGNASPFNDQDLIQACNRLRSYFTQNQFWLNATQQAQVQNVIATNCSQLVGTGGTQVARPSGNTNVRGTPPNSTPKTPPVKANPSSCPPGAKVCK